MTQGRGEPNKKYFVELLDEERVWSAAALILPADSPTIVGSSGVRGSQFAEFCKTKHIHQINTCPLLLLPPLAEIFSMFALYNYFTLHNSMNTTVIVWFTLSTGLPQSLPEAMACFLL